jgi:hypothetical protein
MIVKGTQVADIKLDHLEMKRIAIEVIKREFGIEGNCFIKNGWMCHEEYYIAHNSGSETVKDYEATPTQLEAWNVLCKLMK